MPFTVMQLAIYSQMKSFFPALSYKFFSVHFRWGCNHEKKARDYYVKIMTEHHESFTVADSGLLINPKWPHLGASPDGVVLCDCCGEGLCEVKVWYIKSTSCINRP